MKKLITFLLLLLLFTLTASAQDYFVRQQISNHPALTEVARHVVVEGFEANNRSKVLRVFYRIEYLRDSVDITKNFNPNVPDWIVTNSYRVKILDAEGEPISNPEYNPDDEDSEPYLMEWAFDYFKQISFDSPTPVRLKDLLSLYILRDDEENERFNF